MQATSSAELCIPPAPREQHPGRPLLFAISSEIRRVLQRGFAIRDEDETVENGLAFVRALIVSGHPLSQRENYL
jgi:hypothetical protein